MLSHLEQVHLIPVSVLRDQSTGLELTDTTHKTKKKNKEKVEKTVCIWFFIKTPTIVHLLQFGYNCSLFRL